MDAVRFFGMQSIVAAAILFSCSIGCMSSVPTVSISYEDSSEDRFDNQSQSSYQTASKIKDESEHALSDHPRMQASSDFSIQAMGQNFGKVKVGMVAPEFSLQTLDASSTFTLSERLGNKPIVLLFGSYTWGRFTHQFDAIRKLYEEFGQIADFAVVYISEVHSIDSQSWPSKLAKDRDIYQHRHLDDRRDVAHMMCVDTGIGIPVLIDEMDNSVAESYGAFPTRICVIDPQGVIAVTGRRGPMDLDTAVAAAAKWLERFSSTSPTP